MSFPNKEIREKCYSGRDLYFKCLDENNDDSAKCKESRKVFEESCPAQWVPHFERRRKYLQFKEKMEKEGFDPIEHFNQENKKRESAS